MTCVCGQPERDGTVHRIDGPCWTDEEHLFRTGRDEVLTVDGGKPDFAALKVGDAVVVNGATMYVSTITPTTTDGIATCNFELSALPPDFLAEALYRFEDHPRRAIGVSHQETRTA